MSAPASPPQALGPPAGTRAPRAPSRGRGLRTPGAWAITALASVVYVALAPASPDLAAASYRSELFSRVGFTLWDNSWYGGHHLPAYSLLAPALGALIGPQPLTAISMTAATALFAALVRGRFCGRAATVACVWFAVGACVGLLSSRVPFDLGLAIALGAALLASRGRRAWAAVAAILAALASPVAGAFLALAFLAWGAVELPRRRWRALAWPAALAVAALAPILLEAVAFPEGGQQPFVASAFYPALLGTLIVAALIPPARAAAAPAEATALRALRAGALLYALAMTGSYLIPTAVGGNADRLGALVAGPVAALALAWRGPRRRTLALVVLAPFLLYWQANAPVADFTAAVGDPSTQASYYAPLVAELRRLGVGYGARPARIEVVATANHWEARWVAPHVMIARGWERQLDVLRNDLFYDESKPLTAARYRAWLVGQAVSYVALPDAKLDYSATAEARIVEGADGRRPPSYLREVWHSRHWRLYAVLGASPLVQAPATLTSVGVDSFTIRAPRAGSYEVRLRFTPYWEPTGAPACVSRASGEWTDVRMRRAGVAHVVVRFSLGRVLEHGPRCD